MKLYQSLTGSALVGAAFVLAGCDNTPDEGIVVKPPTAAQLEIVKDEERKSREIENKGRQQALEALKKQSLDGQGRIFYNQHQNELTIYRTAPELELSHPVHSKDDRWAQAFIADAFHRQFSIFREDVTDEKLREVLSAAFNSRRPFHADGIKKSAATVVKVTSGRACEPNPINDKPDCFFVRDVSTDTALGKDVRFAYAKLGLK